MFSDRFIVATINEVGAVNALYRNVWVDCEGGMRLTWGTCVLAAGISTWESTKCKFCSCDCRLLVGACVERSRIRQILDIAERAALRMVWILWDNHVPRWFKTKSSCTWFSCRVSLIMNHHVTCLRRVTSLRSIKYASLHDACTDIVAAIQMSHCKMKACHQNGYWSRAHVMCPNAVFVVINLGGLSTRW